LLHDPIACWMEGNVKVQNAAAIGVQSRRSNIRCGTKGSAQ
jgi:hypothetical protein